MEVLQINNLTCIKKHSHSSCTHCRGMCSTLASENSSARTTFNSYTNAPTAPPIEDNLYSELWSAFLINRASDSTIIRWILRVCAALAPWMHAISSACRASYTWFNFPAPAKTTSPFSSLIIKPQLPSPHSCANPPALIFRSPAGGLFHLGIYWFPRVPGCTFVSSLNSSDCRHVSHANSCGLLLSPPLTRFLSHHKLFSSIASRLRFSFGSANSSSTHCFTSKCLAAPWQTPNPAPAKVSLPICTWRKGELHLHHISDQ